MSPLLTLHHPAAARAYYASGVWRDDTLYSLLARHAAARPAAYALRDPYRRLTWAEALQAVDTVAETLAQAGVRPGERVSIWLPSRVEAAIVFLACSRNGYVCNTSLHQNYTVEEIAGLLESIQCRALFAQAGYGADADATVMFGRLQKLSGLRALFALPSRAEPHSAQPAGTCPFPAGAASSQAEPSRDPDKVVYLAFTSGTTGRPKSVMHSDNTLLANARAMVEDWGHDDRTVLCSLSPASHHIGTVALDQALVSGAELVMTDPASGVAPLDWIVQTGATYVMGVPTHAIDILAAMAARGMERLGNVRVFYMAGSPISRETAERLQAVGAKPQNVYGMTENGSHSYTLPADPAEVIVSTCGRSCRAYEARIWDEAHSDEEVAAGAVGEIGGRGAMMMLGYFDNQAATEATFNAHGYLMSGDLGRVDEAGDLHVIGRKKDLIIRGGHNIHPARIEDLAQRHPGVLRAAAIPVPDPRLGERVCLAIVARGDASLAGEELVAHLLAHGLSKYDLPEFFLQMAEFPLTASGKILKRAMAEDVRAGCLTPVSVRRASERAA